MSGRRNRNNRNRNNRGRGGGRGGGGGGRGGMNGGDGGARSQEHEESVVEIGDSSVEEVNSTITLDSSEDESSSVSVPNSRRKGTRTGRGVKLDETIELSGDSSSSESEGPDVIDEEEEDGTDEDANYVTSMDTPPKSESVSKASSRETSHTPQSSRESSRQPESEDVSRASSQAPVDSQTLPRESSIPKSTPPREVSPEKTFNQSEDGGEPQTPKSRESSRQPENLSRQSSETPKSRESSIQPENLSELSSETPKSRELSPQPENLSEPSSETPKSRESSLQPENLSRQSSETPKSRESSVKRNLDDDDSDRDVVVEEIRSEEEEEVENSNPVTSTPLVASNMAIKTNDIENHPMKVVEEVFEGSGENSENEEEILKSMKNNSVDENEEEQRDDSGNASTEVDEETLEPSVVEAVNAVDKALENESAADESLTDTPSRKRDIDELHRSDVIAESSYIANEENEAPIEEEEQQQQIVTTTTTTTTSTSSCMDSPMKRPKRTEITSQDLPETCTILKSSKATFYLVGTAHFSRESQDDVARTIQTVQPDMVVMELCKSRINIIHLDEKKVLEEVKNRDVGKMMQTIKEQGVLQGILHLLLLDMSAHITKEIGMAPGGEFRTATEEAKKIPGCIIQLGDRPIEITLNRAWNSLSFFQKIRLGFNILFSKEKITKEDVEKCKQKDLLESMLEEMAGDFPSLTRVFVDERDLFLAHSLRMAGDSNILINNRLKSPDHQEQQESNNRPTVVVGVVGIGHCPGIEKNWDTVNAESVAQVVKIIHPSTTEVVIKKLIKYSIYSAILFGAYKMAKGPVTKLIK